MAGLKSFGLVAIVAVTWPAPAAAQEANGAAVFEQACGSSPMLGGSLIGPGPVVAGGMLFVTSGYGSHHGRGGNVVLAFGLD